MNKDESDRKRSESPVNKRQSSPNRRKSPRRTSPRRASPRRRSPRRHSPRRRSPDNRSNKRPRDNRRVPSNEESEPAVKAKKKSVSDILGSKAGGAYIPPARLRMMQEQIADKSSAEYQRISWEALKKSINGLINKINTSNITIIVRELFQENLVRGRGILARAVMQAQSFSPMFSHVYAALVSIINSKFPLTGELILKRLIIQFRRGFRRNDKQICLTSTRFIAHLVNQQVSHEVVALEILTLMLENPTDDAVEVAIGFLKECGAKLTEVSPKGIHAIFERMRSILHEGELDKRVQYMIEVMFAIRKDGFKDFPSVVAELDLVAEADQFTHLMSLDEAVDPEDILNVFKVDPEYLTNEEKYKSIKQEILGDSGISDSDGDESESEEDEEEEENEEAQQMILDNTETNLIALRRTIYLTIQSSLDFEECAHKLLKLEFQPGQIVELCHMILDCCAQQRTYEKFYGLLAQRFCQINKIYIEPFQEIFCTSYNTIHRFETNKLRNVAKFFAHLFYTDAIPWQVLSQIHLNEEETTSSSRIFIKILFQELCEYMGLPKLNERVKDSSLQDAFDGLFPRDNPKNTRFAINFFTSIGLGGLTDDLREHLKCLPKMNPVTEQLTIQTSVPPSAAVRASPAEESLSDSESSEKDRKKKKSKKKNKKKLKSVKENKESKKVQRKIESSEDESEDSIREVQKRLLSRISRPEKPEPTRRVQCQQSEESGAASSSGSDIQEMPQSQRQPPKRPAHRSSSNEESRRRLSSTTFNQSRREAFPVMRRRYSPPAKPSRVVHGGLSDEEKGSRNKRTEKSPSRSYRRERSVSPRERSRLRNRH